MGHHAFGENRFWRELGVVTRTTSLPVILNGESSRPPPNVDAARIVDVDAARRRGDAVADIGRNVVSSSTNARAGELGEPLCRPVL